MSPADCDDQSPCTIDSCGIDGKCVHTIAPGTDIDGDGAYAKNGTCGTDCDDNDPLVHPDAGWYTTLRDGGGPDGSFDWNCDGVPQLRWNTLYMGCNVSQGKCVGSGWATKIRGCGEKGTYVNCFAGLDGCTGTDYNNAPQECR